jgi:hypothetical protein
LAAFTSFVEANGLININPEVAALCQCVTEYKRMCDCDPPKTRADKMNKCTSIYMNFIRRVGDYKTQFMSKTDESSISFYNDSNQRLATISR